jgi:hypothetical protein
MIGTMQAEHRSRVNRCRFEDASLRGPAQMAKEPFVF